MESASIPLPGLYAADGTKIREVQEDFTSAKEIYAEFLKYTGAVEEAVDYKAPTGLPRPDLEEDLWAGKAAGVSSYF